MAIAGSTAERTSDVLLFRRKRRVSRHPYLLFLGYLILGILVAVGIDLARSQEVCRLIFGCSSSLTVYEQVWAVQWSAVTDLLSSHRARFNYEASRPPVVHSVKYPTSMRFQHSKPEFISRAPLATVVRSRTIPEDVPENSDQATGDYSAVLGKAHNDGRDLHPSPGKADHAGGDREIHLD